MGLDAGRALRRVPAILTISCCAALLAACGSQPTQTAQKQRTQTTEYFAESEWGVKASPRVSFAESNLPRGGGREHVGRPYQIRGQWFHPKEDPNYRKTGLASWYGSAFHGRLTANGEVYDMHRLTAAHPTMPLPSYARVTNLDNGTSVIVRVNDRGPFVGGRIIDLSRQSARVLGTKSNGVARVDVEYLGRAPLHGKDDEFLIASYRPGGRGPDPSDGLPTGVMMAMSGPSPTSSSASSPSLPGVESRPRVSVGSTGSLARAASTSPALTTAIPAAARLGPTIPDRPQVLTGRPGAMPALSYAETRMGAAQAALEALGAARPDADGIVAAWQRRNAASGLSIEGPHVAVGTFPDMETARAIAAALEGMGGIAIHETSGGMASVTVTPEGRDLDTILRAAWAAGASDAMTVRR